MSATQEPMPGAIAPLIPTDSLVPRPHGRRARHDEEEPIDEVPAVSAGASPEPATVETAAASASPDASTSPDVDAGVPAASVDTAPEALPAEAHGHDDRYGVLLAAGLGVLGIGGAASHSGNPPPPIAVIDPPKPDQPKSDPPGVEQKPDPGSSKPTGPDQPAPDQPKPDQPNPDQPNPDQSKPDQPTPDQPTPPDPGKPNPDPDPAGDPDPKPSAHVPVAPTLSLQKDTGSSDHDLITASGAVDVAGLEAGATLAISLDGGRTWTPRAGDALLPDSLFDADGAKHLQVRQIDAKGNEGEVAELSFVLDRAAPDAPRWTMPDGKPALGAADVLALQGVEAGALVEYRLDPAAPWLIAKDGLIPASQFQHDGSVHIDVRQTDVAGNVSPTATLVANIDVTAPATLTLSLQKDTGSSDHDLITSSGSVNVSGLEAGATLAVSLDGGKTWIPRGGDTLLPGSLFVTDGEQHLAVRQIDGAGNEGAVAELSFVLDRTAPDALRWTMPDGKPALGLADVIAMQGVEPGAQVEYQLENHPLSPWLDANDGQIRVSQFHQDGTPYIGVRQVDLAGNASPVTTLTAKVDVTVPAAPTVLLLNDTGASSTDRITSSGDFRVSGLESGAQLLVSLDDGSSWKEIAADTIALDELNQAWNYGPLTLQFKQRDAAGNVGDAATLSFTLDREARTPNWSSSNPDHSADATTLNGQDTFKVQASRSSGSGADSLAYRIDGGSWEAVPADGQLPLSRFGADGRHQLALRQTDLAGNVGERTLQVVTDLTPPDKPAISVKANPDSGQGELTIGGLHVGDNFEFRFNGGGWQQGWKWTANDSDTAYLSNGYARDQGRVGENTIEAHLIDAAGNVGAATAFTFQYSAAGGGTVI